LYANVSPGKDHWISAGSGISGVIFSSVATGDYIRIELCISGRTQEENKQIYDFLYQRKSQIESDFGQPMEWERMDDKRMSRVKFEFQNVDVFNEGNWDNMISMMTKVVPDFERSMKKVISTYNTKLQR
jgi:hypothetical protein